MRKKKNLISERRGSGQVSSKIGAGGSPDSGLLSGEFRSANLTRPRNLTKKSDQAQKCSTFFAGCCGASFALSDGHAACIKARRRDSRFFRSPSFAGLLACHSANACKTSFHCIWCFCMVDKRGMRPSCLHAWSVLRAMMSLLCVRSYLRTEIVLGFMPLWHVQENSSSCESMAEQLICECV